MDTRLLSRLPTEQARCREIARGFTAMGSIGCFAAALIEQALQRADRAIIDGCEDDVRTSLGELRAFDLARQGASKPACASGRPAGANARFATEVLPVGRRPGRLVAA